MRLSLATLFAIFLARHAGAAPIASRDLEARDGSALEFTPVELAPRRGDPRHTDGSHPPPAIREIADQTAPEDPSPVELAPRHVITSIGTKFHPARENADASQPGLDPRDGPAIQCNGSPCAAAVKVIRDPPTPVELAPRQGITFPGRPPA